MSLDYYVYLKNPDALSNPAFEEYCASLGFDVELHPVTNLLSDDGFVPVCLTDDRFAQYGGNQFLTGVESFPAPYQPVERDTSKPRGFFGLFQKKPREESPIEKKIKDSAFVLALTCRSVDSFEHIIAILLGGVLRQTLRWDF